VYIYYIEVFQLRLIVLIYIPVKSWIHILTDKMFERCFYLQISQSVFVSCQMSDIPPVQYLAVTHIMS